MITLPTLAERDLATLWSDFSDRHAWPNRDRFLAVLRRIVADPGSVDDVLWCDDCDVPTADHSDANGRDLCPSCFSDYAECIGCGYAYHTDDLHTVGRGWRVDGLACDDCTASCDHCSGHFLADDLNEYAGCTLCDTCRDNGMSYCDTCEDWYHDDDASEHAHTGCECDPPAGLAFTIRNDGADPLANDDTVTVSLAAGTVSEEGMRAIARALREEAENLPLTVSGTCTCGRDLTYYGSHGWSCGALPKRPDDYNHLWSLAGVAQENPGAFGGPTWQTRQGNLPKRLSRYAYNTYGLRLSKALMSTLGNIGSAHSQGTTVRLAVTRDLNLPADAFYHSGSCWWGGYSESRCALKAVGGFGLRTFDDYGRVTGRAWVMPMRDDGDDLSPTFDTMTPDAFVVFNGYGDLSGYTGARIMAHLAGMTYRKIGFAVDYMYVNSGGYLVAAEALADRYTDGEVTVSLNSEHDDRTYRATGRTLAAA
jgi:hypothetical protein